MHRLGIDIAKQKFDVTLWHGSAIQRNHFSNNPDGFKALNDWLKQQGVSELHACMEATGVYYEALAEYLYQQGYTVSVVNPWQIKAFADSKLRRHKTDRLDADLIAEFCQKEHPRAWQPLPPAERTLQALVRHLESLVETRQQQRNRLESSRDPLVTTSLQRVIDQLTLEIEQIKQQIQDHLDQNPDLKRKQELLASIIGIGSQTATSLLAEMPDLADYPSAKHAAADAGLTPSERSSGSSVRGKPRLSKIGNPRVRKLLYYPALAAIRYNPIIKALRDRLIAQGKPKMVAVGAAMRKLVHLAYGVLKHNQPFDPAYVN
ncbi:MAG: IS110 family transposase [Anaerolineae bacterium]